MCEYVVVGAKQVSYDITLSSLWNNSIQKMTDERNATNQRKTTAASLCGMSRLSQSIETKKKKMTTEVSPLLCLEGCIKVWFSLYHVQFAIDCEVRMCKSNWHLNCLLKTRNTTTVLNNKNNKSQDELHYWQCTACHTLLTLWLKVSTNSCPHT